MKTKEIFIVLAILCLLVSVAGVSAEDNNTIKDNKETVLTSFDDSNKVLESSISENLTDDLFSKEKTAESTIYSLNLNKTSIDSTFNI